VDAWVDQQPTEPHARFAWVSFESGNSIGGCRSRKVPHASILLLGGIYSIFSWEISQRRTVVQVVAAAGGSSERGGRQAGTECDLNLASRFNFGPIDESQPQPAGGQLDRHQWTGAILAHAGCAVKGTRSLLLGNWMPRRDRPPRRRRRRGAAAKAGRRISPSIDRVLALAA
jgi:hypothetical protein